MAVINILKKNKVNPENLAKHMPFRIHNNLTYPLGVVRELSYNKITAKQYILWALNKDKKILWLRSQIALEKPIILLIGLKGGVQHYITILGYDKQGFMIYDSYKKKSLKNPKMTIDDNLQLAGNCYIKNDDLLKKWGKGGYAIFFRYWAISSSLK